MIKRSRQFMKRIATILMLGASLAICGCKGEGTAETSAETEQVTAQDTAAQGDNTEMQANTPEASQTDVAAAAAETVQKEEEASIDAAIPNYKKFFSENGSIGLAKYLKSLGYKGSEKAKTNEFGEDKVVGKFTYQAGNKSIKINYEQIMGSMVSKITIDGDDTAFDKFYKDAKKLQCHGDWYDCKVSKKGNTVTIDGGYN